MLSIRSGPAVPCDRRFVAQSVRPCRASMVSSGCPVSGVCWLSCFARLSAAWARAASIFCASDLAAGPSG